MCFVLFCFDSWACVCAFESLTIERKIYWRCYYNYVNMLSRLSRLNFMLFCFPSLICLLHTQWIIQNKQIRFFTCQIKFLGTFCIESFAASFSYKILNVNKLLHAFCNAMPYFVEEEKKTMRVVAFQVKRRKVGEPNRFQINLYAYEVNKNHYCLPKIELHSQIVSKTTKGFEPMIWINAENYVYIYYALTLVYRLHCTWLVFFSSFCTVIL